MEWLLWNFKKFFKEDFCYPKDFIDIDWDRVEKNLQESFIFGSVTFILYIFFNTFLMLQYYVTLPFRLLNEIAEWTRF